MSGISSRLAELGITLPEAPAPVASYIPAKRSGNLVYVSGQLPMRDGQLMATGTVPGAVDLETAQACARQCVLNGLAAAVGVVGTVDRITGVVRVGGFVAADPGFADHPKVINGASEVLQEIFGEAGRHARAAVGAVGLPLDACVEVELILEVAD
jgi:enamine deaminase RidA (YjgF/YER057c/UK114 family)